MEGDMEGDMEADCDVCIVGAGPAGLSIATELARRGLSITVVEAGGWDGATHPEHLSATKAVGYPYRLERAYFSGVGGSALLWTGINRFRPLDLIDFEKRPDLPSSGWPFDLDELWPHYKRAQEILALGPMDYTVDSWAQSDTPPLPLPREEIETAIFQISPKGDEAPRSISGLARGSNFRVVANTTVTRLLTGHDGNRITAVRLLQPDGSEPELNADAFVLAAGGLDNARLLLASNERWEKGLGNTNDLVGRFFMEHPGVRSSIIIPDDPAMFERLGLYRRHTVKGTPILAALTIAEGLMRREGLLNSAIFLDISDDLRTSDVYRSLAMFSPAGLRNMRWSAPIYGENLANIVRHPGQTVSTAIGAFNRRFPSRRTVLDLRIVSEQAPNPGSRVFLDTKRDARGLPAMRLDWSFTELDWWSLRRTQEILRDSLRKAGLGTLEHLYGEERPPARIHGQRHQMGTTRMHPDPKRGVVDADCRVHDVHNLFVAGGSVFPTGGHANPTLTILALASRLADHLGSLFERREGIGQG